MCDTCSSNRQYLLNEYIYRETFFKITFETSKSLLITKLKKVLQRKIISKLQSIKIWNEKPQKLYQKHTKTQHIFKYTK